MGAFCISEAFALQYRRWTTHRPSEPLPLPKLNRLHQPQQEPPSQALESPILQQPSPSDPRDTLLPRGPILCIAQQTLQDMPKSVWARGCPNFHKAYPCTYPGTRPRDILVPPALPVCLSDGACLDRRYMSMPTANKEISGHPWTYRLGACVPILPGRLGGICWARYCHGSACKSVPEKTGSHDHLQPGARTRYSCPGGFPVGNSRSGCGVHRLVGGAVDNSSTHHQLDMAPLSLYRDLGRS